MSLDIEFESFNVFSASEVSRQSIPNSGSHWHYQQVVSLCHVRSDNWQFMIFCRSKVPVCSLFWDEVPKILRSCAWQALEDYDSDFVLYPFLDFQPV